MKLVFLTEDVFAEVTINDGVSLMTLAFLSTCSYF